MSVNNRSEEGILVSTHASSEVASLSSNESLASLDSQLHSTSRPSLQRNNSKQENRYPLPLTEGERTRSRPTSASSRQSLNRSQSNKSSILKFDAGNKVAKGDRRGLLALWSVIPEYENPRVYPNKIKFFIVFVIACCAVIGPMGTSIMMPVVDAVSHDLHTTPTTVNVSVGIYLFTLGFFPIYWSTYSEHFGRRSIYLISFVLFLCFSIGCALSTSIGMLIGFRVLSGAASASVQSVGAGTIADLFIPLERGRAMGIFYLGPLGGPLFLPIIGGALGEGLGWRSTQWFLVIFSGCCCILILFFLPETLRKEDNKEAIRKILELRIRKEPRDIEEKLSTTSAEAEEDAEEEEEEEELSIQRIATNQSVRSIQRSIYLDQEEEDANAHVFDNQLPTISKIRTNQGTEILERLKDQRLEKLRSKVEELNDSPETLSKWQKFKKDASFFLWRPLKSVVFLRYPPVLLAIFYTGPVFSCTYFLNLTLTYAYSRQPYNFSEVIVGLVYIPNSVTYIIASIYGGKWTDKLLKDYAKLHNGVLAPEARLGINVWIAAGLFPVSLLIVGWCLDKKTHWVTPLIGTALYGFASMIVIGSTITYLVDSLPGRGATGVALNNLVRMSLATVACFVTNPLIKALGIGVLFSILAGLSAAVAVVLLVLKKKGTYYRENYDLSKLYDLLD